MADKLMIVAVVAAVFAPAAGMAQSVTLPEQAAESRGKPISVLIIQDTTPVDAEELATADLVVRGKLRKVKSYLSDDKNHMWTDYELVPIRFVVNRGAFGVHDKPGATAPLIVTLYGGSMVIDGTEVTVKDGSRKSWPDDAELMLFLAKVSGDKVNQVRPYGGASGMFLIDAGQRLRSLRNLVTDERTINGASVDEIVQLVTQVAKSKE